MKNTLLTILIIGISFLGCSDYSDNTLVSSFTPINKINNSLNTTDQTENGSRGSVTNGSNDSKKLSVSQVIDGQIGGEIVLDTTYVNSEGRLLNVYARLKFDPGVFDGLKNIDMVPNPENLDIKFYPDMRFNARVKLDYIIIGLDLEAMGYTNNSHTDFVYYSPNGDIELVENDRCNVHLNQQRIAVQGGILYHFSRYGWIR